MLAQGTIEAFRVQAEWCEKYGSGLYAGIVARCADDIDRDGPVARLLDGWTGNPFPDALVMRLMGAVHRLVLDGAAPALAPFYPSVGGTPAWPQAWEAFLGVLAEHAEVVRAALDRQVQTNEVNRSAALLGGFLTVAAATSLPLRLLEIGSSAGLNLGWDRYRYDLVPGVDEVGAQPAHVWGAADAPVSIRVGWEGAREIFANSAVVAERSGCDLTPIDVTDAEQVRILESFVWADQSERLAQLRAAVAQARLLPPRLERIRAGEWLAAQLAEPRPGVATILFHSIMWWYVPEEERERITALVEAAGARASADAPLAWLRMDLFTSTDPEVRLRQWPGGEDRRLAFADAHGKWVRWLG